MAFVDVHQRPVTGRQLGDPVQWGQRAVHREHAIGGDELGAAARVRRGLQLGLQVGHVAVGIAEAPGLAQPHAIDDRGVVEGVGDDRVLLAQQRLEESPVGVEAGRIQDGVLGAEEPGDGGFQLLVQVLGAADETHAGHAEAMAVQRVLGGLDDVRVVGQAQVVVGAEVQHAAAIGQADARRLRGGDHPLVLEQPLLAYRMQFRGVLGGQGVALNGFIHGEEDVRGGSRILPLAVARSCAGLSRGLAHPPSEFQAALRGRKGRRLRGGHWLLAPSRAREPPKRARCT